MAASALAAAAPASAGSALWFTTRATGLVSLVLLTLATLLGVVTANRHSTARWPRFALAALHRDVSLLVVAFLAVHVATAAADSYAPVGWAAAVVPFASAYRPLWLGLGTVAADLLLALIATSLLRVRLGHRVWRATHWLAYLCWPLAVFHGLGTGSDGGTRGVMLLAAGCVLAVLVAMFWRLRVARAGAARIRVAALAASVALPIALVAFLLAGPTRPGWARRAGTPASLLTNSSTVTSDSGDQSGAGSGGEEDQ